MTKAQEPSTYAKYLGAKWNAVRCLSPSSKGYSYFSLPSPKKTQDPQQSVGSLSFWYSPTTYAGISMARTPMEKGTQKASASERVPAKGMPYRSSSRPLRPLFCPVPLIHICLWSYRSQQLFYQFEAFAEGQCHKSQVTVGFPHPPSASNVYTP